MSDYIKLENETDDDYINRVCEHHAEIGSWTKVAEIINNELNLKWDESTYRKRWRVREQIQEAIATNQCTSEELLSRLEAKEEKLRKERIKIQTMNAERNRIDRAEARQELFYENVGKYIQSIPAPEFNPLYESDTPPIKGYLQVISDVHYGATFESQHNSYSPEICKARFESLAAQTIDFIKDRKIKVFSVLSCGDLIQGLIHLTDLKLNDSTLVKSVVDISRIIASYLTTLSQYAEIVYHHVPASNHTQLRVFGANRSELPNEDVEYIIGNYIKDLVKSNPRISVHLASKNQDYVDFTIMGNSCIAMHGHQIKDVNSALSNLELFHGLAFDVVFMGHFHAGKEMVCAEGNQGDKEVIIAPSFIGSDPYSDSLLKGAKSSVKIYGLSVLKGITESYKIVLN